MKLLLWTAVFVFVVLWLMRGKKLASSSSSASAQGRGEIGESMLQCVQCRVHFPASEAVTTPAGAVYCSEEHRVLHGKR